MPKISIMTLQRKHFYLWYWLTWIHHIDSVNVIFVGYSLEHFLVGFHYCYLRRNKTINVVCEGIYSFHQSQLIIKRLNTQIHISWHIFCVTILFPISLWINIQYSLIYVFYLYSNRLIDIRVKIFEYLFLNNL